MSPKLLNILLIAIPFALYYGYIDPAYSGTEGLVWTPESSILVLQSKKVQYENALDQAKLVDDELAKITKDYSSLDKDIRKKVEIMLPDAIDKFRLRNEVVSIASVLGIALSNLVITDGIGGKNSKIGGYKITFNVKGDYAHIKKLIESYEKSTRFFAVQNIRIVRIDKKDESNKIVDSDTLDATIGFEVYYLKP
jgi:hypothetical protein